MKKETFLQLHERLLAKGLSLDMSCDGGLCGQPFNGMLLDENVFFNDYFRDGMWGWWAWSEDIEMPDPTRNRKVKTEYSPLRQNIILLCAAINGEL